MLIKVDPEERVTDDVVVQLEMAKTQQGMKGHPKTAIKTNSQLLLEIKRLYTLTQLVATSSYDVLPLLLLAYCTAYLFKLDHTLFKSVLSTPTLCRV